MKDVVFLTEVDLQLSPVTEAAETLLHGAGVLVRGRLVLPPRPLIRELVLAEFAGESVRVYTLVILEDVVEKIRLQDVGSWAQITLILVFNLLMQYELPLTRKGFITMSTEIIRVGASSGLHCLDVVHLFKMFLNPVCIFKNLLAMGKCTF